MWRSGGARLPSRGDGTELSRTDSVTKVWIPHESSLNWLPSAVVVAKHG